MIAKIMLVLALLGLIETTFSHVLSMTGEWLSDQGFISSDFSFGAAICDFAAMISVFLLMCGLMIYLILRIKQQIASHQDKSS